MILIGLGANLASAAHGAPRETCEAALECLAGGYGIDVLGRSRWFASAPVPVSDQPWFVNGVAVLGTALDPPALLQALHAVERRFGRVRGRRNAARVLDLDLLAYGGVLRAAAPVLPHPRLHERAFVLRPLAEIAPEWRHPRVGRTAAALLAALPPGHDAIPLDP